MPKKSQINEFSDTLHNALKLSYDVVMIEIEIGNLYAPRLGIRVQP